MSKIGKIVGHEAVSISYVPVVEGETHEEALNLTLGNTERVEQLRQLLRRGMNTWDTAPTWLVELDALVHGVPLGNVAGMRPADKP